MSVWLLVRACVRCDALMHTPSTGRYLAQKLLETCLRVQAMHVRTCANRCVYVKCLPNDGGNFLFFASAGDVRDENIDLSATFLRLGWLSKLVYFLTRGQRHHHLSAVCHVLSCITRKIQLNRNIFWNAREEI
jgi:hypothetical protein